ncbi:hypothetical protein ACN38_g11221 [Penicillium nordicum]|uniref:Uncharacterized protein n=1 Tax=Penicillium nordicum TaxID=229535 RepID=A0A0M8NZ60_9EURO|nr:hypothetical protein ACN38_g11221 [Penicillium nordicum]
MAPKTGKYVPTPRWIPRSLGIDIFFNASLTVAVDLQTPLMCAYSPGLHYTVPIAIWKSDDASRGITSPL